MGDTESSVVGVGCSAIALVVVLLVVLALGSWECSTKADGLHLPWQWNPVVGCRVEIEPGLLVPIDNVRWIPGVGPTTGVD